MALTLTSTAFESEGMIPAQYTCDGADVSPPLAWSHVPAGTETLVLIVDDPDAPGGTWVHWVLFNIPSYVEKLDEGIPALNQLKNGAQHGITDFRNIGYGGPCPSSGTHRYDFKLYALDTELNLKPGCIKRDAVNAMQGHILGEAVLMGTYKRAQ